MFGLFIFCEGGQWQGYFQENKNFTYLSNYFDELLLFYNLVRMGTWVMAVFTGPAYVMNLNCRPESGRERP